MNIIAPVDPATGKYELTHSAQLKFRRAQNVPSALRDELLQVCRDDVCVSSCYLLDVLEPASGDTKLWICLSLDNPQSDLDRIAPQMQQIFRGYPEYTNRFFIGTSDAFDGLQPEHAAYTR